MQALHDDTHAIKTLHRVEEDSNKVRSDMNIANIIVSELVVMACHLNLANNPPPCRPLPSPTRPCPGTGRASARYYSSADITNIGVS